MTPSVGSSLNPKVGIRKAEFGDGYSQASPAGINHIKHDASLKWEVLTGDERQAIVGFFEANKGTKPFDYHIPGDAQSRTYTCAQWNSTALVAGLWTMEATFEETFSKVTA